MKRGPRRKGRPVWLPKGWSRRLGQRLPWYSPDDSLEGRNIRNLYAETAWFGILSGLAATFVSVYALRLGATTDQVGWLAALPALVNVVWLIPAARLIERQRKRMPLLLLTGFLQRLGYMAMAIMPFWVVTGRVEILIILNTLITVPAAVINTAMAALLPEVISAQRRGQVISVRWLILAATATLTSLLGGRFLDLVPVPVNYPLMFGIVALLSMLSLVYLGRMRIPGIVAEAAPRVPPLPRVPRSGRLAVRIRLGVVRPLRLAWAGLRGRLGGIVSHREFVRFAIASFVFFWGLYLPAALWSVLRVRDLGASDGWIGTIAVVIDGSTIGGYLLWGRVRTKWGDRRLLNVTSLAVTVYAFLTALVPTIGWMIPTSILGGISWAGCNLALFNVMLSACPDDRRASYVALYTALMNVTAFAGPLLGAALADGIGIRWAFVLSGGVRLAGGLLFILLVRPPHK